MLARSVATLATLLATAARELDPAACAARFDVQRDKIIRTEESRDMGARYLSELDVGARHECRRLCCETDACDVFVFEEKSPGSCYLFNCGPPEDFRCKFTAHSNFSSGVLALSRRLAELQDQERLQPPAAPPRLVPAPVSTRAPTPAPTRAATAAPSPAAPAAAPAAARSTQAPHGRCSRYQWECHSGGECIAVYNACDGVAQCADGSDEAPELGCPAAAPPAPQQGPPVAPPHVPPAHSPRPEPPPALPMYPAQEPGAGRWPHRLLQAQPPRDNNEVEGEPHIFSHKGGLLQAEAEPPPFEPPPAAWPRRAWPQHTAGVESGWGGWSRGGEWDARRAWPPPEPELPPYLAGKTMPELALLYPASHALRDAAKKAPPAPAASPAPAPPPPRTPPPPHATHENTTKKKAAAVQSEVAAAPTSSAVGGGANAHIHMHATNTAQAQRDERDGLSEHPPSAVLLLILGVAMTGALGVLLAVRARAARRRRGGRGRGLAHDADYLVNGMYL